jgi:hypothetical protein
MYVRSYSAPARERVDLSQTQLDLRTPSDRTTTASAAAKPVAAGAMSATGRTFLAAMTASFSGSSQSTEAEAEAEADEPSPSEGRGSNLSLLLSKPGEVGEDAFRFRFRLRRSASSDQIKSTRDSSRAEAVATMSSTRSAQTTRTPSARTKAAYWLFRARQRSSVVARIYRCSALRSSVTRMDH